MVSRCPSGILGVREYDGFRKESVGTGIVLRRAYDRWSLGWSPTNHRHVDRGKPSIPLYVCVRYINGMCSMCRCVIGMYVCAWVYGTGTIVPLLPSIPHTVVGMGHTYRYGMYQLIFVSRLLPISITCTTSDPSHDCSPFFKSTMVPSKRLYGA